MAYRISNNCAACGACQADCPSGAISEGEPYRIDPELCLDCGACESACPNGAVHSE